MEFHASRRWFERWKVRFNVSFKAIAGEEKAVTPGMTKRRWETPHGAKSTRQV